MYRYKSHRKSSRKTGTRGFFNGPQITAIATTLAVRAAKIT